MKNLPFSCLVLSLFIIGCSSGNKSNNKEIIKLSKNYGEGVFSSIYMDSISYYEKASFNGKYIMYNEASGYMLSMGKQSPIPLDNVCFLFTNFGNNKWLDYLENKYAKTNIKKQTDIPPDYNSAINSFRRFELFGPLNPEHFNEYQYNILEENSKNKRISFISNVDSDIGGTIFYNSKYQISKIVLNNFKFYSQALHTFKTANITIEFDSYNQQKLLSSIIVDFKYQKLQQIISLCKIKTET